LAELADVSSEQLKAVLIALDRALYSATPDSAATESLIASLREEPGPANARSQSNASLSLYPSD
ncbi:MAG: hypothetical protein P8N17_09375, partial [Luminiphilus sp.]|nr:hypothetical protein [Luminiphilus sp.]